MSIKAVELNKSAISDRLKELNKFFIVKSLIEKKDLPNKRISASKDLKYISLHEKAETYRDQIIDEEIANTAYSSNAIEVVHVIIDKLKDEELIESNVAIHLFPMSNGGFQIELDGEGVKADIEINQDESIIFTRYEGEHNTATEEHYGSGSIGLLIDSIQENLLEYV